MIVRNAVIADVGPLVDVQQEGALLALGHIFPQDVHPFPREVIEHRWLVEIADPGTQVYVCADADGRVTGFAATRADELLHFGTSPDTWGSGLASELHDAVLAAHLEALGLAIVRLRVFEANARARRFYEKRGWTATGRRSRTSFAPHPELVEYVRSV